MSSSHHQPKEEMKWKRNSTPALFAAVGTGRSTWAGPRSDVVVRSQMLLQVAPPSTLTSTSADCPLNAR